MNIPKKPKPPKRYSTEWPEGRTPVGSLRWPITDEAILTRLGMICSHWPHLEEAMLGLCAKLIGDGPDAHDTARQMFHPINSVRLRTRLMRSLLENGRQNQNRGPEYDDILNDLDKASEHRNQYVHGLWHRHANGTYLHPPSVQRFDGLFTARAVTENELDEYLQQLKALIGRIMSIR